MTAELTAGHAMWPPSPALRHQSSRTIEDVPSLPPEAPRVELRDGVMLVVPSPTPQHQEIGNLPWLWFRQNAPAGFAPVTAVGVAVGFQDTFEPGVVLLDGPFDKDRHYFLPSQVASSW